jgi:2-C-methyl-D-erythritol 4-phosphate cytidylyltransferase/2-C-methyl-D-erythritol 2,4-cyclodiphosphate synthase
MCVVAIIVAAGRGSRMLANYDFPKQYLPIGGKTILRRTIEVFLEHKNIDHIITIINPLDLELYKSATIGLNIMDPVFGGDRRQDSVRNGLEAINHLNPTKVLIHDAARPFVNKRTISGVVEELDYSRGVVPGLLIEDTVKKCEDSKVLWTIDRSNLWSTQTPQGFGYQEILKIHREFKSLTFTDDAAIAEHANLPVTMVVGSKDNFKITTDSDYERAESFFLSKIEKVEYFTTVGFGYDIHKFSDKMAENGLISLGCIKISHDFEIDAHSDGDLVAHAVIDSILGAMNLGDIGEHFPPSDEKYRNISGITLLSKIQSLISMNHAKIVNLDITIVTEAPKILPSRDIMKEAIADVLKINKSQISIKGKTKEGVDAVGRGEAIECYAICSMKRARFESEECI